MLDRIKKAVFIGAHTDDEMVCAGTLRRLVDQGAEVQVITASRAATKEDRKGTTPSNVVYHEWSTSMELIGARYHQLMEIIPSSSLQARRQEICQTVFDYCEQERPDCAFILSPDDQELAHRVVAEECERVMRGRVAIIVRCRFPWNYEQGHPNLFVNLSEEQLDIKRRVINAYKSQKFRYQYGEMLLAYCTADGLSVKVPAAEKFEVIRCVV